MVYTSLAAQVQADRRDSLLYQKSNGIIIPTPTTRRFLCSLLHQARLERLWRAHAPSYQFAWTHTRACINLTAHAHSYYFSIKSDAYPNRTPG
eukprot:jgi/Botrbrau1/3850/Bobra.0183s0075.1